MGGFAEQVQDLLGGGDRLVTQYMHDWDGRMTEAAIRRVAEEEIRDALGTHREDGRGRIRPSNLSETCPRLHALSYLGYPNVIDAKSRTLMDDGTERHYFWQKVGLSAGFLSDIEVPVRLDSLQIKGSIDGLMVDGSVFEFKEVGPKIYEQRIEARQPTFDHLLQVHAYMKALGTGKASVVYERRSYGVEWHEFRIEWDAGVYRTLQDRVWPALEAIGERHMPDMIEECQGLSGPTFKGCGYHDVCPSATFRRQRRG